MLTVADFMDWDAYYGRFYERTNMLIVADFMDWDAY